MNQIFMCITIFGKVAKKSSCIGYRTIIWLCWVQWQLFNAIFVDFGLSETTCSAMNFRFEIFDLLKVLWISDVYTPEKATLLQAFPTHKNPK